MLLIGWFINNLDNDIIWEVRENIVSINVDLIIVVFIDNYSYDVVGEEDDLVIEYFDLSFFVSFILEFVFVKV